MQSIDPFTRRQIPPVTLPLIEFGTLIDLGPEDWREVPAFIAAQAGVR